MQVGDIVTGEVKTINNTHLIVELNNGVTGLLHISEVSDYYVSSLKFMFEVRELYNFIVIDTNGGIKLSWKKIVPRYLKNPFRYDIKETEAGFKTLLDTTMKEVQND